MKIDRFNIKLVAPLKKMGSCVVTLSTSNEFDMFNNLHHMYNGSRESTVWNKDIQRWETKFIFMDPLSAKLFYDKSQNLPGVCVTSFNVGRLPPGKTKEQDCQN